MGTILLIFRLKIYFNSKGIKYYLIFNYADSIKENIYYNLYTVIGGMNL